MEKQQFLNELEFVKKNAEIEVADKEGNVYEVADFGTNEGSSIISILIKKK